MARKSRFTIYDMMDEKGVFEGNPRNTVSAAYKGPAEYPKMLYHPTGEYRITQKAEIIVTPMGPRQVGEQKELISRTVQGPEEEADLLEKGWHRHPAQAIAASGAEPPATGVPDQVSELEKKVKELTEQLAAARAQEVKPSAVRRNSGE